MKNIFEILETEGRVYITDFELATALGLDLGDIVSIIEKTSQQSVENDYRNRPRTVYTITAQGILHLLARYGRYDYHLRSSSADSINDNENASEHLYRRISK